MTLTCFEVRHDGPVAHIVFNRPDERNTLIPRFWTELRTLVTDLDAQSAARVIVISSTGRHFSAGLDLSVIAENRMSRDDEAETETEPGRRRARLYQGIRSLQRTFSVIEQARVPVIAAVQGGCVGAALALVSACDLRYATRDAFFLMAEINLGITAEVGQLQRLPRVLPDAIVREMAMRGTRLPAARAESVGFVNELFDDHDALLDGVSAIAAEIATKSPLALWGSKRSITYSREHSVEDGLDQVALWQAGMYYPDDPMETFRARQADRDPDFDDLLPFP